MVAMEINRLLGRPPFEQTRNYMSLQSFLQSLGSICPAFHEKKSKMCFFNMVARETNLLLGRPSFDQTRKCMSLQLFVQSLDSIHPQFLEKKSNMCFLKIVAMETKPLLGPIETQSPSRDGGPSWTR